MSGKARELRDRGEVNYVSACEELKAVIGVDTPKRRTVTKGVDLVHKSWEKLKDLHADYCRISKIGISSTESRDYIAEMGKLGREATEAAMEKIGDNDETENQKALEEKKEELTQLRIDVEIKLVTLTSLAKGDLSGEKHGQALGTLDVVGNLLKQYMECNNRVVKLMKEEDRKE